MIGNCVEWYIVFDFGLGGVGVNLVGIVYWYGLWWWDVGLKDYLICGL